MQEEQLSSNWHQCLVLPGSVHASYSRQTEGRSIIIRSCYKVSTSPQAIHARNQRKIRNEAVGIVLFLHRLLTTDVNSDHEDDRLNA